MDSLATIVAKVELVWRYFYQQQAYSLPQFIKEQDFSVVLPQDFPIMIARLKAMVAGERVHEIRYPLDWWQAIRERWFPQFWLKWFPVKYHKWHVDLLYPLVEQRRSEKYGVPEIAIYSNTKPASPGFLPNREEDNG